MTSIFISYSSVDRGVAQEVRCHLQDAGFGTVFLDADPDDGLTPGSKWERQLYQQLGRADAVVFLASSASAASKWCHSEIVLARATDKPVLPVRITADVAERDHPLVADLHWLNLADGAERIGTALHDLGVEPADDVFPWGGRASPYPGLEAFQESHSGVFFGRDQESQALYDLLHPVRTLDRHRFVAVVGPSGSGKSSLVRAGLIPRLRKHPGRWLVIPPVVPRGHPTRELARCLTQVFDRCGTADRDAVMAYRDAAFARLSAGDAGALVDLARELADLSALHARSAESPRSGLLVIDQAEELVTRTGRAEQARFLDLLSGALEGDADDGFLWVVATIRADFLNPVLQQPSVTPLLGPSIPVGALPKGRLFEVIERPAGRVGLRFSPGLVGRMVEETEGGDALPLLAFTLQQLAERATDGVVTERHYGDVGGVLGALRCQADKVRAELVAAGHGDVVLPVLLRLAGVDGNGNITSRRVRYDGLTEAERLVLDAFTEARLTTSDTDPETGERTVQVAHEALLRQWQPLRSEIEAQAEDLRHRAEVERAATDWARSGRHDSYLLHGERLAALQAWAEEHPSLLHGLSVVDEFLHRSLRVDRIALAKLSDTIAAQALAELPRDPEHGLLLARAAVESLMATPLAQRALLTAVAACRTRAVLRGHTDIVGAAAVSPCGRRVATCSRDRTVRIWDRGTAAEVRVLRGHTDWVEAVAWDAAGRRLASGSRDRTIRIWDAVAGTELTRLDGHDDTVKAVAWCPDGRRLASSTRNGTVRMWDVDAAEPRILYRDDQGVDGIAVSPDGRSLATACGNGVARVWDTATGAQTRTFERHDDWIEAVSWAPDGARLVTGSRDRTARTWDPRTGVELSVLRGHDDWVEGVAWSHGGAEILTASEDRTARIWDAGTGAQLAVLRGHGDWVRGAAWTPDDREVVTTSADRTARIWDLAAAPGLATLVGHGAAVESVRWSPNGDRLATGAGDRTIRIWSDTGRELAVLPHVAVVAAVAWAPDGRRLAGGLGNGTVLLWDVDAGYGLRLLEGHEHVVKAVAWSADGTRVATASADRGTLVWNAATGAQLHALRGHEHGVEAVRWSPDGALLATAAADRTACIWTAATGSVERTLHGHGHWVVSVAWSPDGRRLATGSGDRTARIWDAATGECLRVLPGHEDWVEAVEWSPDGTRLATASRDGTARVWATDGTPGEPAVVGVHGGWIRDIDWSPDSTRLATASADRLVHLWPSTVDLDALLAKARARSFAELGDDERSRLMLA